MTKKKLLLGLHNVSWIPACEFRARAGGYDYILVSTLDEMREQAGQEEFDRYVMDANLGDPGSEDISPSRKVYERVRRRVESGEARFMAVSNNLTTVGIAKKEGIPATASLEFFPRDFKSFLSD